MGRSKEDESNLKNIKKRKIQGSSIQKIATGDIDIPTSFHSVTTLVKIEVKLKWRIKCR